MKCLHCNTEVRFRLDENVNFRHLRTRHHGVVTVAYSQEDRYTYLASFGFCSPNDTFNKARGREEALKSQVFVVYRPEGYSLDNTWIDFLSSFYEKSSFKRSENRYQFENEISWPRWLPEFIWSWRFGFSVVTACEGWFPTPTITLEQN